MERIVLVEGVTDRKPDRIVLEKATTVQLAPGHGDEPEELLAGPNIQVIVGCGQLGPPVRISRVPTLAGAVDDLLVLADGQIRVTTGGGIDQPLEHRRLDIVVAVDE